MLRLSSLVVSAGALILVACPSPDRVSINDVLIDDTGAIHLVVRHRTGEGEGGGSALKDFYYLQLSDGDCEALGFAPTGSSGRNDPDAVARLVDSDGEPRIVIDSRTAGLTVASRASGVWRQLTLSRDLADDARVEFRGATAVAGAWTGSDDVTRVVAGPFLFEADDTEVRAALPVDPICGGLGSSTVLGHCYLSPTGDRSAQAANWIWQEGVTLVDLTCDDTACGFAPTTTELGSVDSGGDSSRPGRFFFHLTDGTPRFVRRIQSTVGQPYAVVEHSLDGMRVLVPGNVYFLGAAPRPVGGYAVAAQTYDDDLLLILVAADGEVTQMDLGSFSALGMNQTLTVVAQGTSSERVHVYFGTGERQLRELVVDPETSQITQRALSICD